MDEVLITLEQKLKTTSIRKNPFIEYEFVESEGLSRLEEFYGYVKSKKTYDIIYTPFGKEPESMTILPVLLKEYNQRWTLIGFDSQSLEFQNFPLDRIGIVKISFQNLKMDKPFDSKSYFKNVIGNTISRDISTRIVYPVENIKFKIKLPRAFYVDTKKIHQTQIRLYDLEGYGYMIFEIQVITNNEMWAKFLEFGADIEILSPQKIKETHISKLKDALVNYGL